MSARPTEEERRSRVEQLAIKFNLTVGGKLNGCRSVAMTHIEVTDHAVQRYRERAPRMVLENYSPRFIAKLVTESMPCGRDGQRYYWWHPQVGLVFVTKTSHPNARRQALVTCFPPNNKQRRALLIDEAETVRELTI